MQNSILDRIFPPSSPLLPQHNHRVSSSSSLTTSPLDGISNYAPGSSSAILRAAPISASLSHHEDPLLLIERAAKSLQSTTQSLLDAQSECLLAGLANGNEQDELSSNGSLTPTATMSSRTTPHKPTTIPIRQPPQKKISLRAARRGLSHSMREFAALKRQEGQILETELQDREAVLKRVEDFINKRRGIHSTMASISSESGAQSAGDLRAEANELDMEIRGLENRLFEMKARYRHLLNEAQQLENALQSKLSSYHASLELLDKNIRQFLARPPIAQLTSGMTDSSNDGNGAAESFYALHPKRRTLEMASEHWRMEQAALKRRKESTELEETALRDGGRVWGEVVIEIQTFEKGFKAIMGKLSLVSTSQQERDEDMTTVLNSMATMVEYLERHLKEAEENGWKLLICSIGAELEAFRQGREILMEASGLQIGRGQRQEAQKTLSEGDNDVDGDDPATTTTSTAPDALLVNPSIPPHDTNNTNKDKTQARRMMNLPHPTPALDDGDNDDDNQETSTRSAKLDHDVDLLPDLGNNGARRRTGSSPDSRSESEDDDPGPDFLISHNLI